MSNGRTLHSNSLGLALTSLQEKKRDRVQTLKKSKLINNRKNPKTDILSPLDVRPVAPRHFNIRMRSWPCAIVMRFSLPTCKTHKTFFKKKNRNLFMIYYPLNFNSNDVYVYLQGKQSCVSLQICKIWHKTLMKKSTVDDKKRGVIEQKEGLSLLTRFPPLQQAELSSTPLPLTFSCSTSVPLPTECHLTPHTSLLQVV